jgi:hypothetical protein
MARVTGLEPATSGVTGRHSNQLSYTRAFPDIERQKRQCERSFRGWKVDCQALAATQIRGKFTEARDLRLRGETPRTPRTDGRLAQLVERFVYTEDVGSSSLSSPTIRFQ